MNANIEVRIEALCNHADEASRRYFESCGYTHSPHPIHRADYISSKWCRIVTVERSHDGTERDGSVYCFVALQDNRTKSLGHIKAGDIHKAASWKSPARHARGSVYADDFSGSVTHHGASYIR